ncbi:hypothetical protein WKR88_19030 [Trinickia caryophylli]|uniref:Uncharacterized protein n=1 Tax=Trinickia caryophylli TaxID=28094 RepID=A0A1X7DG69_TRICW|nr:hypothetical protein [Trinickia caryophylli]PMS12385.1 hypothetical protein C0Z17_10565 [Trinickia caryophylli]TRX16940.1 hypothetical protein FNF07_00955 [Trinickia caryophylli]WQE12328.1 hypothetical protein U0034_02590 [Trinickia caryophylli]SMF15043.1 hypothetical protein SAMN06295900_103154 [Trinickia caryophylli]GLU31525.1 hypothetical protein Busp01_13670 [Trinickia caryophylli]
MAENDNPGVIGVFHSYMTPSGYTQRADAERTRCDSIVPPAADSMIGHCEYYYRPLGCAYTETVEKVSTSSAWVTIKAFATSWNPWTDKELVHRLLYRREQLIPPNCTDSDWSRHSNFMMRHIGCGHKPPSYYVSYGYYYCSHYGAELFPKLSAAGQDWLRSARWYLQKNMEDGLSQNMKRNVIKESSAKPGNGDFQMIVQQYQLELNEEKFKDFAFKTHPLAYLDGGIAHLPPEDLFNIMRQPRLQEWGSWGTFEQVGKTGWGSVKTWVGDGADAVSTGTEDLVSRAIDFLMAK